MTEEEQKERLKAELDHREQAAREKMEKLARKDFGKFIDGVLEQKKLELKEAMETGDPKNVVMATVEVLMADEEKMTKLSKDLRRIRGAYEAEEAEVRRMAMSYAVLKPALIASVEKHTGKEIDPEIKDSDLVQMIVDLLPQKPEGHETLEMQIIALWRKRGLVVKEIRVDPPGDGQLKWTVIAEELDGT